MLVLPDIKIEIRFTNPFHSIITKRDGKPYIEPTEYHLTKGVESNAVRLVESDSIHCNIGHRGHLLGVCVLQGAVVVSTGQ
jgi:hypothetical protein